MGNRSAGVLSGQKNIFRVFVDGRGVLLLQWQGYRCCCSGAVLEKDTSVVWVKGGQWVELDDEVG
jgi:hypothetical protein